MEPGHIDAAGGYVVGWLHENSHAMKRKPRVYPPKAEEPGEEVIYEESF